MPALISLAFVKAGSSVVIISKIGLVDRHLYQLMVRDYHHSEYTTYIMRLLYIQSSMCDSSRGRDGWHAAADWQCGTYIQYASGPGNKFIAATCLYRCKCATATKVVPAMTFQVAAATEIRQTKAAAAVERVPEVAVFFFFSLTDHHHHHVSCEIILLSVSVQLFRCEGRMIESSTGKG